MFYFGRKLLVVYTDTCIMCKPSQYCLFYLCQLQIVHLHILLLQRSCNFTPFELESNLKCVSEHREISLNHMLSLDIPHFLIFGQLATLNLGLHHYGSRPFNIALKHHNDFTSARNYWWCIQTPVLCVQTIPILSILLCQL